MNEHSNVTLVSQDDWQTLYVNGSKHSEGHSLSLNDTLEAIQKVGPFEYEYYSLDDPNEDGHPDFWTKPDALIDFKNLLLKVRAILDSPRPGVTYVTLPEHDWKDEETT